MTGIRAQCFKSKKNVIGRIEGVDGGQKALDSVELMLTGGCEPLGRGAKNQIQVC